MSDSVDRKVANMPEELALPRTNGELVFATPWEARAFGIAIALNEGGTYAWRNFSEGLAAQVAAAERAGIDSTYYERWLEALAQLALAQGLITAAELNAKMADLEDDHHHHSRTKRQSGVVKPLLGIPDSF
ncbi:MAG: nitrile hydratase accessory protein [Candidatus Latescibacterota bacterium]|nr:nitrile hydratase accessory protein [Candidatus Latescibacterota bacterium]